MNKIIAITGGIGSGKSVVSKLLRVMGHYVYDCDARAKWVMTHDSILRQQLIDLFGPDTYLSDNEEWLLNKPYLSSKIFGDAKTLAQMNACVHPAVARDLLAQRDIQTSSILKEESKGKPFFFESAILFESRFNLLVPPTSVWMVSAPLELRIERAMKRDHSTREQVLGRIDSQLSQEEKERRSNHIIYNDPQHSLIAQVNQLLLC